MESTRYKDDYGNIEKIDFGGNHFINGKCANPKSWEAAQIGDTFSPDGLTDAPILEELEITGHVSEFSYYDHDAKETVYVVTQ